MRTSQARRTHSPEYELDNLILLNGTAREYYPLEKPSRHTSLLFSMVFGMLSFVSLCVFIGAFAVSVAGIADQWNTAATAGIVTAILSTVFTVFFGDARS